MTGILDLKPLKFLWFNGFNIMDWCCWRWIESSYEIVDSNGTVVAAASEANVDGIVVNSDCSGLTDGGRWARMWRFLRL